MTYNKLVRDKIPDIIRESGEKAIIHIADDSEYRSRLLDKIVEEAREVRESDGSLEEIADLITVLEALRDAMPESDRAALSRAYADKLIERGGFRERIVLDAVRAAAREAALDD